MPHVGVQGWSSQQSEQLQQFSNQQRSTQQMPHQQQDQDPLEHDSSLMPEPSRVGGSPHRQEQQARRQETRGRNAHLAAATPYAVELNGSGELVEEMRPARKQREGA